MEKDVKEPLQRCNFTSILVVMYISKKNGFYIHLFSSPEVLKHTSFIKISTITLNSLEKRWFTNTYLLIHIILVIKVENKQKTNAN